MNSKSPLPETAREIAARLSKTMQCNCDLDNWEPERLTGHSRVCRIHKAATQELANARLIAASPDLLAALELAERYLVERGIEFKGFTGRTIVLPAIRAAIAKTKGGSAS